MELSKTTVKYGAVRLEFQLTIAHTLTNQSKSIRIAARWSCAVGVDFSTFSPSTYAATTIGSIWSKRSSPRISHHSRKSRTALAYASRVLALRMVAVKNSTNRRHASGPASATIRGTTVVSHLAASAGRLTIVVPSYILQSFRLPVMKQRFRAAKHGGPLTLHNVLYATSRRVRQPGPQHAVAGRKCGEKSWGAFCPQSLDWLRFATFSVVPCRIKPVVLGSSPEAGSRDVRAEAGHAHAATLLPHPAGNARSLRPPPCRTRHVRGAKHGQNGLNVRSVRRCRDDSSPQA